MPIRFRPPRDVPDLGLTRGQQERFNAWLRTAFTEIAEDMATLGQTDAPTIVAQETIDVAAGSLRRVTPPSGGMAVRVPAPTPANAGQTVRLMIEAPVGALTVVAVPGIGDDGKVFQPTINGEQRATFSTSGLVTLTSNGSSDWKSASEFAAESPASIAISSGGAALDATYLLRSANASLPNARVADDSTEIDISYSSPGLISWFLKTASVAFSKLADLAGLSVLGRATNSSGVMAAITATQSRQVLRNNDAGTSLEWEFPLEAQQDGVDLGNVHTINRLDGGLSVAAGVATLDAPTTIIDTQTGTLNAYTLPAALRHGDTLALVCSPSDVTLNGIVAKPAGFGFYLNVSGAAARILTINDESGSATALDRLSLPANLASRNPPGASFWVSYASTRWLVVERAITEVQDGGSSQGFARTINAADTTSITGAATISSGTASLSFTRAALTGFAAASANSNATTSAEPIITYSASANMSAERVLTTSTSNTIDISVAGQAQVHSVAKTGAISQAANANATLFAGIRDNGSAENDRTNLNFVSTTFITAAVTDDAGNDELEVGYSWTGVAVERNNVAVGSGVTAWDYGVTAPLTLSVSIVSNEVRVTYGLDLAATIAWTGGHSWSTAGDFTVTAAIVGLTSNSTLGLDSVGDMTLQSDGDLHLIGDEVRVRSNGTGGFLTFDGATASTPGLAAGEGMFWVEDPGAAATIPRFTDDSNVDWKILAFGQPGDSSLTVGNNSFIGTAHIIYRDVVSSGSAAAGDTNIFSASAPFSFTILASGMRLTAGTATAPGATQNMFRDATGGGGNALSSQFSTAVASAGNVQYGASFTGAARVASGGTLTFRWADRTCEGRIWMLIMRE